MASYLVELYLSRHASDGLHALADQACESARQMTREGTPVRYLRSIFLPEDETCFCLYESSSAEAVARASQRAGLSFERVTRVVEGAKVAAPPPESNAELGTQKEGTETS